MAMMIDTENLTKKFGNLTAVENLTLNVKEGEVFGFLGPRGRNVERQICCANVKSIMVKKQRALILSGSEDKRFSLGVFGWLDFPVRVALDLFEACYLKIVEHVPVREESYAFAISKYVYAVGSFDYARFLFPRRTLDCVKVLKLIDSRNAYATSARFFHIEPFLDHAREPALTDIQRIVDVAD